VGPYHLVLAQTKLEVGSDRHQWAHSASCPAAMVWISTSWRYSLSTLSMVDGDEAFRGSAAAASVRLPLWLVEGTNPLD
jgi:hypothetical protein